MKKNTERTYWNVKESSIDKALIEKIQRGAQINRLLTCIILICNLVFCILLFCIKHMDQITILVIAIIDMAVVLSALIIEIVLATKMLKLKKQVKVSQVQNDKSSLPDTPQNETESQEKAGDKA